MKKIIFIVLGIIILIPIVTILYFGFFGKNYNETVSVEVNAPIDHAFQIFMDESKMSQWMNTKQMTYKGMENISGGHGEIGSQWKMFFNSNGRELEMIETVIDYKKNELFAFNIKDDFANFNVRITFEEANGNTIITDHTIATEELPFFSKVMMGLFGKSARKQKEQMYFNLKELIEND